MGFIETIRHNFVHYADFKGRAQRSQYWWWALFVFLSTSILNVIDGAFGWNLVTLPDLNGTEVPTQIYGGGPLASIWFLVLLIPGIAVAVRRLHDRNMSGWWYLLNLLCCIGSIILFVWYLLPGTKGENRFGPDPLAAP